MAVSRSWTACSAFRRGSGVDVTDGTLIILNVDHGACALLKMSAGQAAASRRNLIKCGHSTDYQGSPGIPATG
jgi:hypothetical protein